MNLDAFRRSVLTEAREDARRELDSADDEVRHHVTDAQAQAARLVDSARREGREAAELETRRRRSEARRGARERVLHARRDALEQLRRRVLELLLERRGSVAYRGLLDRLETTARNQLAGSVEIERTPDGGGLVAHVDGRRVDYRLPVLVDSALEGLGTQLEELWR